MKVFLSVLVNKFITKVLRLLGRNGSQLPGAIVLDHVCSDILTRIKYPKYVIAVTGSSGKGTTCGLIKHTLEMAGYSVSLNENGSNGVIGATTLILNNCNLKGEFKSDVLLLECDERHLKLIFTKNKPTHLVITNVTRDQPARNGTPEIVFNDILKVVDDNVKLIINKDDPLVNRVSLKYKNIVSYGISKCIDDVTTPLLNCVDFAYCPKCNSKLEYSYYHYGHLGNYKCPKCDFSRNPVMYEASKVDLSNKSVMIDNNKVNINNDAIYTVYATCACYSLCKSLNISDDIILDSFNKYPLEKKRGKSLVFNNRNITMLETKNENNLSYYQSIRYIKNQDGLKTVILGFENVSRRYKYNDLSWLYDVNFELLDDDKIDKIFLIGRFRYDVMERLEFTNIDKKKIVLVDDINNLLELVKNKSKGNIYTMVCFDMTGIIKNMLEGANNED